MHITVTVATAAAMLVVTNTRDATSAPPPDSATVEPPLKPNQQNHRMKQPRAPSVREWPGIARALPSLVYLPIRGPRIAAPTKAATPPTICTAVEPAKSWKPSCCEPAAAPDPVTGDRVDDRGNDHASKCSMQRTWCALPSSRKRWSQQLRRTRSGRSASSQW